MKHTKKLPGAQTPGSKPSTTNQENHTTKDLLDAALDYARQGFAVFPCTPRGKSPMVSGGHKSATTNPKQIRAWWSSTPDANIGWVPPKNTAVLDVDPRNGGTESLNELKLPELMDSLWAKTGGGGYHILLTHAPDRLPGKIGKGLDVKSNGRGYIIVAPSVHQSGKVYSWLGEFDPNKIQPWPKGLNKKPEHPPQETSSLTPTQIESLLAKISPEEYETWIAVGQILKAEGSDLRVWDTWSRQSSKYPGVQEIQNKWDSFKGKGRGAGSLVYLAGGQVPTPDAAEEFERTAPAEKGKIQFRHISEIVADKREPRWLLDDILEAQVLGVLAGPRGSFKSFIALEWAMRVALGGFGVIILSGEGAGLDRRTDAWIRTHSPDLDLKKLPMLALERVLNLNANEVVADLVASIRGCGYPISMVVIDTLSKYSPGADENNNTEMSLYLSRLAVKIRDALDITVLLVAHTGHGDQGRPRGASALMANPDAEYIVNRGSGMFVTVTRDRFKDTPSLPRLSYAAEVVDLGRVDSKLRAVTSLALLVSDAPGEVRTPKGAVQKEVWGVIKEMFALGAEPLELESVIGEAVKGMVSEKGKRDQRRMIVTRAVNILVAQGFFGVENGNLVQK